MRTLLAHDSSTGVFRLSLALWKWSTLVRCGHDTGTIFKAATTTIAASRLPRTHPSWLA